MRVFKYTEHAIKILTERKIKLSSAHKLNDPFELAPSIPVESFTEKKIRDFLKRDDQIRNWYKEEGKRRGFSNLKKYRHWYLANLDDKVDKLRPGIPRNVEAVRSTFAERFDQYFRFFCASKRRDSILMWSHYAKNHEGFVVEFDTESRLFKSLGKDFVRMVEYKDGKPAFHPDFHGGPTFMNHLLRVASTKSKDWSYEEEARLIFPRGIPGADDFFPVSTECICSVVIGCRCPTATRMRVKAILDDPGYMHVSLWQAKLSADAFKLEFDLLRAGVDGHGTGVCKEAPNRKDARAGL
jgi:hypothetical protein